MSQEISGLRVPDVSVEKYICPLAKQERNPGGDPGAPS